MIGCERILCPRSLDEALSLLAEQGEHVTVSGGGTDLFVAARLHPKTPVISETLMCIRELPELAEITLEQGVLSVGAGCTFSDIIDSDLIKEAAPLLVDVSLKIASPQIRAVATVGGNVMNASPAGDALTALVCLGATAVLAHKEDGEVCTRSIPVAQLVIGPRKTLRRPDELLLRFKMPAYIGSRYVYEKVGLRSAMAISVASAAILVENTGQVHIALGSMSSKTVVNADGERMAEKGDIPGAVQAMLSRCTPIDDIRATAEYRMKVIRNILARNLEQLLEVSL